MRINSGWFRPVLILTLVLGWASPGQSVDSLSPILEDSPPAAGFVEQERFQQIGREAQERFRLRVAIPDAVQANLVSAPSAEVASIQSGVTARTQPSSVPSENPGQPIMFATLLCLGGMLALLRAAHQMAASTRSTLTPGAPARFATVALPARGRTEHKASSHSL
jgi:hypothetical protein